MNHQIDILWMMEGRVTWDSLMELDVGIRAHMVRRVTELKEAEAEEIESIRSGRRR